MSEKEDGLPCLLQGCQNVGGQTQHMHWLKRYHLARLSGRKHKIKFRGLKRACRACKLPHPSRTSLESILGQLKMCATAMKKMLKKAPRLCKDMLIRRLVKHVREKNEDAAEEVRRIIQRKASKDWVCIGQKWGSRRSLTTSKVTVKRDKGGRVVHAKKVDVHGALCSHLNPCF